MYYNAELRKTVRHLPGYEPPQAVIGEAMQAAKELKHEEAQPMEPTIPHTDELTEQEHFIPIDFDKAMSVEGHESQVVHVSLLQIWRTYTQRN